jgi:hypothetical protein
MKVSNPERRQATALPKQEGSTEMMKYALILSASVTLGMTAAATAANTGNPAAPPLEVSDGSYEVAGMVWRCGKNNPAWWGTFGNGCLKQKRQARKNGSASTGTGNFAVEQPAPPPAKRRFTQ